MIKYTKNQKLGEGTFAIVYAGTEISTNRKVAIKKIKPNAFPDGIDLSALREITALRDLLHPNIITLIDVISTSPISLSLVLEYLDADLEMIIKNRRVLFSAADIKSWMLMTLKGTFLNAVDDIKDLKPNNLLLSSTGTLKLADFGLAREYGDPFKSMTPCVVTRWYRAPELLLGAVQYSPAIDIWAIGCIFAELMLRTPYLAGESDINQLIVTYKALGTPCEADWPGMSLLPDFTVMKVYLKSPLKGLFTAAGDDALDFLAKMLVFNPIKRISAKEALSHFYFKNLPRPTPSERLPRAEVVELVKPAVKRKVEETNEKDRLSKKLFIKR